MRISSQLMDAWETTVLKFARFKRNAREPGMSKSAQLDLLLKQERGAVMDLWDVFNENRTDIGRYLSDPKRQAIAYLLGFHLPNLMRAQLALERMQERAALFPKLAKREDRALRVIDLGCGTGAMAQAVVDHAKAQGFSSAKISAELVDQRTAFLDIGKSLIGEEGIKNVRTIKCSIADYRGDYKPPAGETMPLSVFTLGYVFNETVRQPKIVKHLIKIFLRQLEQENPTIIMIADSANQSVARAVMEFRDQLVELGYHPVYPCPHARGCPLLEKARDWCYSEGVWQQPAFMQRVDKILEINRERFASAAYVFASPDLMKESGVGTARGGVIVGRPERKGEDEQFDYLICDADGISKVPAQGRNKSFHGRLLRGELL